MSDLVSDESFLSACPRPVLSAATLVEDLHAVGAVSRLSEVPWVLPLYAEAKSYSPISIAIQRSHIRLHTL